MFGDNKNNNTLYDQVSDWSDHHHSGLLLADLGENNIVMTLLLIRANQITAGPHIGHYRDTSNAGK